MASLGESQEMGADQKNFHTRLARVSPSFFSSVFLFVATSERFRCSDPSPTSIPRSNQAQGLAGVGARHRLARAFHSWLAFSLILFACSICVFPTFAADEANSTSNVKREAASAQFAKAEELRAALDEKSPTERSLAEYKQLAGAYRRVALITPRAPEVPDSLLNVGEVYTEMGDRFGRSYYQLAVDSYLFLVREYPGYKHGQEALLRAAKLQRENLNDTEHAAATYNDFLKRFPRSPHKREAQEALAELALLRNSDAPADARATQAPPKYAADESDAAPKRSSGKVSKQKEEASARNDRDEEVAASGGEAPAPSGYVPRIRRIRAAATPESTRVTIDLEDSVQYTSGRVANPERIFFDLHAARLTPELLRGKVAVEGDLLSAVRVAQNQAGVVRIVLDVNDVKDYTASLTHNPTQLRIDLYPSGANPLRTAKSRRDSEEDSAAAKGEAESTQAANVETVAAKKDEVEPDAAAPPRNSAILNSAANSHSAPSNIRASDTKSAAQIAPAGPLAAAGPATSMKSVKASGTKIGKPEMMKPAPAAQPTRDGNATLTRVLGLKIGRIVIDPGHGGHDTGTIGPTGLMEKDLCLDIGVRLGKIIQQRLPGAEVVFTRSDDTFIPLEERTAIANEAKADLFVSIHANSSPDHAARGVETYYLNLKGSAESMEVAARENAAAQTGVHDLEDLVKRITQTEKVDESKEFAQDVQVSLSQRIQKTVKTVKNRGVRKAPFLVLIGADMPSILTEISFLSNPADELLLKKPEHRQRVAEGIYQGMAAYLQSLNSVTLNLPPHAPQSAPERPLQQSRNQR